MNIIPAMSSRQNNSLQIYTATWSSKDYDDVVWEKWKVDSGFNNPPFPMKEIMQIAERIIGKSWFDDCSENGFLVQNCRRQASNINIHVYRYFMVLYLLLT